jgi:hypothetical protein
MRPFHRGEPAEHGEAEVAIRVTKFLMVLHRKMVAFIVRAGGRDSDGSRNVDTKNRWTGAVLSAAAPRFGRSILTKVNHRSESRVREIRLHGSEGGEAQYNGPSLPLSLPVFVFIERKPDANGWQVVRLTAHAGAIANEAGFSCLSA